VITLSLLLVNPAREAGIKVPPDEHLDDYAPDEYPHWHVYLLCQIGAPMPHASAHWENAKVIAEIPEGEIRTITRAQLTKRGFAVGRSK